MPREPLPDGPFLRARAIRAGLTQWELRRAFRPVFRGVYVPVATVITDVLRYRAALLLAAEGSYLSHHSAARLLGGVVPDDPDVHLTSPGPRARMVGIAAHRAKQGQAVTIRSQLPVTTAGQTFLDLAQSLTLVDLVVLGDSLVKTERVTPAELVALAAEARGPHSRRARRAAGLVRQGVDSPMETRVRLLIVLAGLPEPKINHTIRDDAGRLIHRYDLSYPDYRLVIEYDGRQHAESQEQWHSDISREEQLDNWRVRRLVVVANDVYRTPANTLRRIVAAMVQQGMTVPVLSEEWRRHFPSRPGDIASPA